MSERRGWMACAVLLVLGAAMGAGVVREHWLTCRGAMLNGSALRGFTYGQDFSDACLEAMDNGFSFAWPDGKDPWRPETVFGVACSLLLALAWIVVIAASRWSLSTRLLAAPPAILTAAAGLITAAASSSDNLDSAYVVLLVAISLTAVVALVAIVVREKPEGRMLGQIALALAGSSAIGFIPLMADYAFMTSFSDANWDTPPGTGSPTVVVTMLLGLGLLAVACTARSTPAKKDENMMKLESEPQHPPLEAAPIRAQSSRPSTQPTVVRSTQADLVRSTASEALRNTQGQAQTPFGGTSASGR